MHALRFPSLGDAQGRADDLVFERSPILGFFGNTRADSAVQASELGLNGELVSEQDAFGRILAALHAAALDPDRWADASALIDEALGTYGSSLLFGAGDAEEDIRIYFCWTHHRGQRRRDLERLYFTNYYSRDERAPRMRHAPDSQLFHMPRLYTVEERRTSPAYNALRTHAHSGNGVIVRLNGPGGSRILWDICEPVNGDDWSSGQLDAIRRLLPHVRQFVTVQQTLAGACALGATLGELLDTTGLGVIHIDARGRIVTANDRALSVLRAGDILCEKSGFLFANAKADDDTLQAVLERALPPFAAQGAGGSVIMKRTAPLPPLVVHVNPLSRQEAGFGGWPVAALVLLAEPARGAEIDPGLAAAVLGLTPMESRVAVMLAEGMSVREIAAAMTRKESTIRFHVKSIFARHGLNRQAELVRLVLSLAGAADLQR